MPAGFTQLANGFWLKDLDRSGPYWCSLIGVMALLGAPAPPSSYNLPALIATMRADPEYGALFTSTANPYSPTGLALPSDPQGALVATPVASLAALRAAAGPGQSVKRITLTPGAYNELTATTAVLIQGNDLEIVLTGCTISTLTGEYGLRTHPNCRRVKIIGGTINSGKSIAGRDIKLYNVIDVGSGVNNAPFGGDRPSNQCIVGGHRINFERCTSTLADSTFFVEPSIETTFNATFNGTATMTVNSVDHGVLEIGQKIVGIAVGTPQGMSIASFGTGTGGVGTYNLSVAGPSGTTNCFGRVQSTNCFAADCNFTVPTVTGTDGTLHENPIRLNGTTFSGCLDCRLWCDQKHTWRSHGSYTEMISSTTNFCLRTQHERGGLYGDEPGATGLFPGTVNIILDYRNGRAGDGLYRPSGLGNNLMSIPYLVGASVLNTFVFLKGFKSYSAPHEGTAGQGVLPTGLGSPNATWTTCVNAVVSLANGNAYFTYVAPPAWSFL